MKVEDLKVFPAVAAVIGKGRASIELFKVVTTGLHFSDYSLLSRAFVWANAPQGCEFWRNIHNGVNPYAK